MEVDLQVYLGYMSRDVHSCTVGWDPAKQDCSPINNFVMLQGLS